PGQLLQADQRLAVRLYQIGDRGRFRRRMPPIGTARLGGLPEKPKRNGEIIRAGNELTMFFR
ncbi:hypothetical protein, partial [Escherichia coli]|uniref:hypothetical protein n=1 Tax=Escherichia coli TaxID=562 RepID=UPI001BFE87CA